MSQHSTTRRGGGHGSSRPNDSGTVTWASDRPAFVQTPEWLVFHPEVSDAAKMTWVALASWADRAGEAFPGVRALAGRRGKSQSSVFNHLKELEDAGALRRTPRYRANGSRTSTLYVLAWATPLNTETEPAGPVESQADPPPENWRGPRPENLTPRTRPKKELKPPKPPKAGSTTSHQPARGAAPPSDPPLEKPVRKRGGSRARGTNPRALADRQEAAQRQAAEVEAARAYGARMGGLDPPLWEPEAFAEYLTEDTGPKAGWGSEAVAAALEAFHAAQPDVAKAEV